MIQKTQSAAADVVSEVAADVLAGRLEPGSAVPSVRALAGRVGCSPGTAARAHALLRDAGVIAGRPRSRAVVAPDGVARAWSLAHEVRALRLCGSDDPALDLLTTAVGPAVARTAGGRGSVGGLSLLAQGRADAAAVHLRDATTGRTNDVFARRLLGGRPARIVHLWRREQGIVVPRGNPRGIRGVADLRDVRIAWRPPGTGSRLLLSRLLHEAGVAPAPDGEVCESHLGVAVAVTTGAVEAGLAVRSAAAAADADFVPVGWEDFELAVDPEATATVGPLLATLGVTAVQDRVAALEGYDLSRSGDWRDAA